VRFVVLKVAWRELLTFLESEDAWQRAGQVSPRSTLKIKINLRDGAGPCRTDTRLTADKDLVIDLDTKDRILNLEFV
jgi:hypothetical protein